MNALLLGLAVIVSAPALKSKGDPAPILGLWALTEWYIDGQPVNFNPGSATEFLPEGKRLLTQGRGQAADERGYKLHPKTSPAAIDYIRPSDGAQPDIFLGIYKVDGDTLTIALANMGNERSKSFEPDKEGTWTLMKFKRVKKE
jgi:RNA polymerase sigma-70 factor (ECF subfamily)